MTKILVSGLINIETTLKVDSFPLTYEPARYPFFGINSSVAGVGYNIAKALTTLGDEVIFLSIIGRDLAGEQIRLSLSRDKISDSMVLGAMPDTAQSVIIYNKDGKRQIHTDLKDIQDRSYPVEKLDEVFAITSLAILCNVNYNRPLLARVKEAGIPLATDVHTISSIEDAYNCDFMDAADILFLSDEALPCSPEAFARRLQDRYGTAVIVIGLGAAGALLSIKDDNFMTRIPAVQTRPVVNTIGAGDALFSSFLHAFNKSGDPHEAIRKAVVFSSYKIGDPGAAEGFLNARELEIMAASL
jgi:sugar/nucleoside kinase (ribokinase family)